MSRDTKIVNMLVRVWLAAGVAAMLVVCAYPRWLARFPRAAPGAERTYVDLGRASIFSPPSASDPVVIYFRAFVAKSNTFAPIGPGPIIVLPYWRGLLEDFVVVACSFSLAFHGLARFWGSRVTRHRRARGLCLSCGYNLTANTTGVCPECGTTAAQQPGTAAPQDARPGGAGG
jgi:hypothetical protein